jgi:hypothetical protein
MEKYTLRNSRPRFTAIVSRTITICLAVVATGCIPVRMTVGKHIDGHVFDRTNGHAIAGATVMYRRNPKTSVMTDMNGRFTLERTNVWFWAPLLPVDYFGYTHFPIVATAKGYRPETLHPEPGPSEIVRFELVPCEPAKAPSR